MACHRVAEQQHALHWQNLKKKKDEELKMLPFQNILLAWETALDST